MDPRSAAKETDVVEKGSRRLDTIGFCIVFVALADAAAGADWHGPESCSQHSRPTQLAPWLCTNEAFPQPQLQPSLPCCLRTLTESAPGPQLLVALADAFLHCPWQSSSQCRHGADSSSEAGCLPMASFLIAYGLALLS